jgi:hypothetical protein
MKKEIIEVPIYFAVMDKGKIVIDEESIRDVFEEKLEEIVKNPKKFVEWKK